MPAQLWTSGIYTTVRVHNDVQNF